MHRINDGSLKIAVASTPRAKNHRTLEDSLAGFCYGTLTFVQEEECSEEENGKTLGVTQR